MSNLRTLLLAASLLPLAACPGNGSGPDPVDPADKQGDDKLIEVTKPGPTPDQPEWPAPPELRLPAGVAPTGYQVHLDVDPTRDTFSGTIEIALRLDAPTDFFWMNGTGLTITSATMTAGGAPFDVTTFVRPETTDFFGVRLGKTVPAGDAQLTLAYSAPIALNEFDGVFKQQDGADFYVYTQFEAMAARKAFPCFDEPSFKVPWELAITVPEGLLAFSNTAALSDRDEADAQGKQTYRFQITKPLPSYLVAFAVGAFEIVDGGKVGRNKIPQRVIVPRGRTAEAPYAVATLPHLVDALEAYFDMPLPYDKMDHIAVPQFFGAMENPGLITYAASILLSKPENETPGFHHRMAGVAAHELAHQWFGDLVTMKWWDDIWLNESFATWMAVKVIAAWMPEWQAELQTIEESEGAMRYDLQLDARKMHNPVVKRGDIEGVFDPISYGKGGGVLSMFERWIGPDKFREGMRAYMKQHAWGNADSADFIAALAAVSDPGVPAAFETFLEQAGVPLLSVGLTCEPRDGAFPGSATLTVAQERLLAPGVTAPAQTWKVPMCVRYDAGGKSVEQCELVSEAEQKVTLAKAKGCPAWVMANSNGAGYYRVVYGGDLGAKLLDKGFPKLAITERLSLVGDLGALSAVGRAKPGELLAAIPQLAKDKNGDVVGRLVEILETIDESQVVPDETRPSFARFIVKTFGKQARGLGWKAKKGERDDQRRLRGDLIELVAEVGGDAKLLAEARKLVEAYLAWAEKGDAKAASPVAREQLDTVMELGVIGGDAALYDRILARAKASTDDGERSALIGGLGAFRDVALVERNLGLFLDGTFTMREGGDLIRGALSRPETRPRAWELITTNWEAMKTKVPRWAQVYMVYMASGFCSTEDHDAIATFFADKIASIPNGERAVKQTLEGIALCAKNRVDQGPALKEFFAKY